MPKSVNKVILVGNLGKDPEVKYTPSGTAVATFSVATSENFKDKEGQWQERTEWHNVKAWARTAEVIGQYVKKGNKIYIEGRLTTESWDDKNSGEKKYKTMVVANEIVLLGGRGESGGGDSEGGGYSRRAGAGSQGGASSGSNYDQRGSANDDYANSAQITDEDIPF